VIERRTRLLARTAFERFFENDLFSSSISASTGMMWIVAALAAPGVMFSGSQYYFYAHARTFTPEIQDRILFVSQVFHIHFAMAVAAVVTMLVWTSLTPDRRDALVLGPLPLQVGEQARARLLAVLQVFSMFAAAVALPTAVAFTFVTMGESSMVDVVAGITGHICGVVLGAAFVFFVLVDLQLLVAATCGPSAVRMMTVPLQAAALVAMVGALSMTGRVADAMLTPDAARDAWVSGNPAAWFVGVYRWIAGDEREVFALLAATATLAAALVVSIAVVAYPIAYGRCLQHLVAGEGRRASWWSGVLPRVWLGSLRPWLRTPLERGLAAFITATLTRSHAHRVLIGSYLGMAALCALPLVGRLLGPADSEAARYAWFSVPLGLLCWSAAALRVAVMLPVEPASNWIFKLTEPVDKHRVMSTTVTVMLGATAVPLALGFGLASAVAGGWMLGVTVGGLVLAAGTALVELLTLTMRTVPGACTYRPGQLRLRVLWPVYLLVWTSIAYVLPRIALAAFDSVVESAMLMGSVFLCGSGLRLWRLSRSRRLTGFVYEAWEPAAATTIDLSSAPLR
jgi:hypothetical protein